MRTGQPNITQEQLESLANGVCEATEWEAEIVESSQHDAKIASFADEDEALEFLALAEVATGIRAPDVIVQRRRNGRVNLLLFTTGEEYHGSAV